MRNSDGYLTIKDFLLLDEEEKYNLIMVDSVIGQMKCFYFRNNFIFSKNYYDFMDVISYIKIRILKFIRSIDNNEKWNNKNIIDLRKYMSRLISNQLNSLLKKLSKDQNTLFSINDLDTEESNFVDTFFSAEKKIVFTKDELEYMLTPKQFEIFVMHIYQGISSQDIAKKIGKSAVHVNTILRKCRIILKKEFL